MPQKIVLSPWEKQEVLKAVQRLQRQEVAALRAEGEDGQEVARRVDRRYRELNSKLREIPVTDQEEADEAKLNQQ